MEHQQTANQLISSALNDSKEESPVRREKVGEGSPYKTVAGSDEPIIKSSVTKNGGIKLAEINKKKSVAFNSKMSDGQNVLNHSKHSSQPLIAIN